MSTLRYTGHMVPSFLFDRQPQFSHMARGGLDRYAPFRDAQHPCPRCGKIDFMFRHDGTISCQRCGTPTGRHYTTGVFGTATDELTDAS